MAAKQGKKQQHPDKKKKQDTPRWNETELRLITGAATLAVAFGLSQLTGISHERFYGSFQRFISGFFVLVLLYLIVYAFLYRRNNR